MWFSAVSCLVLVFNTCHGVIYHLNDSEHHRMPRLFDLDYYDSCLANDKGLYCVMRVDLFAEADNALMNQIKEYSAYTAKHYNYTYLERGLCITHTCKRIKQRNLGNHDERHKIIEECFNTTLFKLQANVTQIFNCDANDEKPQMDVSDWMVAGVIAALVTLVFIVTLYDVTRAKDVTDEGYYLLLNFSLSKNWNDLVNGKTSDPSRKRLEGLRGFRAITNWPMIFAHVLFIDASGYMASPHAIEKTWESFYYHLVYNGLVIVQIFFFMSAFLQSYLMHIRSEVAQFQWSELPKILFGTWWRLSWAYAILLAFSGTWLRHLGSGPLWKRYVSHSVVAECRPYWPHHLLYVNNYVAGDTQCQVQTWHLAVEMQLFVVTMLVYMSTRRREGRLALGMLLLAGLLGPPLHVWLQDVQALAMITPEFLRHTTNTPTLKLAHVVGLATGSLRWGVLSWLLLPGIGCMFLTGRVFFAEGAKGVASLLPRLSLYFNTHYETLCMCAFFSWRGWLLPNRLSYGVCLLHMNLVHVALGLRTQLATVTLFYTLVTYLGIVAMSVLVALPFYLVCEAPLAGLLL